MLAEGIVTAGFEDDVRAERDCGLGFGEEGDSERHLVRRVVLRVPHEDTDDRRRSGGPVTDHPRHRAADRAIPDQYRPGAHAVHLR